MHVLPPQGVHSERIRRLYPATSIAPSQPEDQNGPVTIDLVAAFQSVLDKVGAPEAAKREAFRNDTQFRIVRVLRAEMMELRERRAALSLILNNSANLLRMGCSQNQ